VRARRRPPITGALHDVHLAFTAPDEGTLANFNGTASFTYTARSGAVSLTATVTTTVTLVNDAPTISDLGNVTIDAGTYSAGAARTAPSR